MKNIIFELSQEHPTLPTSEAQATLQAENIPHTIVEQTPSILHIQTTTQLNKNQLNRLTQRLALTFHLNQLHYTTKPNPQHLLQTAKNHPLPDNKSFRVRCIRHTKNNTHSPTIEQQLGAIYYPTNPVDLHQPDIELRVIQTTNKYYVCIKQTTINRSQYEQRKVQQRPFFSPISLHPRIARTLVNLAQTQAGETILDPFCGTGGILLEAGLINMKTIGGDIKKDMIHGCTQTLNHYNIKDHTLIHADVEQLPNHLKQRVDAIVTDFPYGKSTTTNGEQLSSIYHRAFNTFTQLVKPNKHIVIGVSEPIAIKTAQQYLTHVETHTFRVHRSLTRYFAVFKNK